MAGPPSTGVDPEVDPEPGGVLPEGAHRLPVSRSAQAGGSPTVSTRRYADRRIERADAAVAGAVVAESGRARSFVLINLGAGGWRTAGYLPPYEVGKVRPKTVSLLARLFFPIIEHKYSTLEYLQHALATN